MESTGRPGACQLSAETYAACQLPQGLLPPQLVEIKGKGLLTTYSLQSGMEAEACVRRALAQPPPRPVRNAHISSPPPSFIFPTYIYLSLRGRRPPCAPPWWPAGAARRTRR